ncbi:IPIL1 protein, partial [Galbula dea]|nr:IPIL1 protein [Galbula dea]
RSPKADTKQEDEECDDERDLARVFPIRSRWPMQELFCRSRVVKEIVDNLLYVLQKHSSKSFLPVLQPAIGVGNAFEGWSPSYEDNTVYQLLVPLEPPRGHIFQLEMVTISKMLPKAFRVRVELELICTRENMLYMAHHPQKEPRRRKPWPSLLNTILCTGSYLDVLKIALWFQKLVRSTWMEVPQACFYEMKMLHSSRSCMLKLKDAWGEKFRVEMIFGVQRGNSDIFLCSQISEAIPTLSTIWSESYAVAEGKFFKHMARQVPRGNFHLKCLHLCIHKLACPLLSAHVVKTAVMHLLTTIPVAGWCGKELVLRMQDTMKYLQSCLEKKRLNHFFFGNEKMPKEIILPPAFQGAKPNNLFQHLELYPAARCEAMR